VRLKPVGKMGENREHTFCRKETPVALFAPGITRTFHICFTNYLPRFRKLQENVMSWTITHNAGPLIALVMKTDASDVMHTIFLNLFQFPVSGNRSQVSRRTPIKG
jgi:hypothetical protein